MRRLRSRGRMMLYGSLLLLAFGTVAVVSACEDGGGAERQPEPAASAPSEEGATAPGGEQARAGKVKIGFSMDTLLEERWLKDRELFKAAAESLGAQVDIMAANGDDALQIAQAETLISRGIDLLVVVPHNAEAMATIVEKAHSAGIKVLAYDRLVRNASVDMYVSFDNERVGELQALAITKLVPRGNYVYIGGAETDNNARLLKKGVFHVLQPLIDRGDIRIVYDQWTDNWVTANAYANMQAALAANGNDVDAVIAANDATADAVIRALAEQGLAGKVPVAGQDADLTAAQHIVGGRQTMTVYKPIKALAQAAAELAVKLATGEAATANRTISNGKIEVPSLLLEPIAVDRSTVDETIIADGFHKREDVYRSVETK
ncbi:sugar ABC transporter substrate-binding protein [Paenibacillus sp.]|uniref:sugar ABC transporter substrate-binding protein n=1 Tax=Paenibacillus sp. TaxID=58172 RepID=UPI002D2580DB|nr:substrate-binding domain-containing protein [Paenibacillus sp.]HZG84805.1 substrate-binding domain-containing protein [Paenibacillus sp.]